MTDERCGTYAGAMQHQKQGESLCDPCREARRTYMKEFRQRNARYRTKERAKTAARGRALTRLAREFPARFIQLYDEEVGKL